jgi:hypothetical protein
MKLEIEDSEIITDQTWKVYLARAWKPGQYKRWYLRSLQETFDANIFPFGWDTPNFVEDNEWLSAMELKGPADKASASNGNSNYQLDISGNIYSELHKRSIPIMK